MAWELNDPPDWSLPTHGTKKRGADIIYMLLNNKIFGIF